MLPADFSTLELSSPGGSESAAGGFPSRLISEHQWRRRGNDWIRPDRPDRVLVGEVRQGDAADDASFQAHVSPRSSRAPHSARPLGRALSNRRAASKQVVSNSDLVARPSRRGSSPCRTNGFEVGLDRGRRAPR